MKTIVVNDIFTLMGLYILSFKKLFFSSYSLLAWSESVILIFFIVTYKFNFKIVIIITYIITISKDFN